MSITIKLRKKDVGEVKDFQSLMNRLSEKHGGKWVAILRNGKIVARKSLKNLYKQAGSTEVAVLFQAPKKDQQYYLPAIIGH